MYIFMAMVDWFSVAFNTIKHDIRKLGDQFIIFFFVFKYMNLAPKTMCCLFSLNSLTLKIPTKLSLNSSRVSLKLRVDLLILYCTGMEKFHPVTFRF